MSKWRGWHRLPPPPTPWGTAEARAAILAPYLPEAPAPPSGAATLGVHAAAGYTTSDSGATPARNTQATTGLLVFAQWETDSAPPTITDNQGNTYGAPFWTAAPNAGSLNNWLGAWFIPGASGGAGHVITASKVNGYPSVWLVEAIGATAITHAGQADTTSPYNSGNLTTSGERLLVGFVGEESTGPVTRTVNSAGFTALSTLNDGAAAWTGVTAARSNAPAGTYSFDVSVSGTGVADGAAIIVAVEGVGGGGIEYPYTASGGAATGGAGLLERTYSRVASGGLTSSGAAAIARRVVRSYTATGGLVSGGAALLERNFQPAVGGDIATGGSALLERTYSRTASGGLTSSGAALVARRVVRPYTATGGAILGGAAALERAYSWPASGGLTTGGEALAEYQQGSPSHVASGGVVVSGEGFAYRVYTYVAEPPELPTEPGPSEPGEVIIQQVGGGGWIATTAAFHYTGGGRVRTGGAASVSAMLRPSPRALLLASGPRLRLRGSANAYALPRPRRNRDLEDLALANLARTAR